MSLFKRRKQIMPHEIDTTALMLAARYETELEDEGPVEALALLRERESYLSWVRSLDETFEVFA